jgi:superoxide dismutase, Cu-Zn family
VAGTRSNTARARARWRISAVALALLASCSSWRDEPPSRAEAFLAGRAGSRASGLATFTVVPGGLRIVVELFDAEPGPHGVHVHDIESCAALANDGGRHFNPDRHAHGEPGAASHAGDLGNLEVGDNGIGRLELVTRALTLDLGARSCLGLTIAVGATGDDFHTQPTGDSGFAIACGEIRAK